METTLTALLSKAKSTRLSSHPPDAVAKVRARGSQQIRFPLPLAILRSVPSFRFKGGLRGPGSFLVDTLGLFATFDAASRKLAHLQALVDFFTAFPVESDRKLLRDAEAVS
jgi:hypothetical protein